jgi:hypothetical protein
MLAYNGMDGNMKILSNDLYKAIQASADAKDRVIESQARMIAIQDRIIKNDDVIINLLKDRIKKLEGVML